MCVPITLTWYTYVTSSISYPYSHALLVPNGIQSSFLFRIFCVSFSVLFLSLIRPLTLALSIFFYLNLYFYRLIRFSVILNAASRSKAQHSIHTLSATTSSSSRRTFVFGLLLCSSRGRGREIVQWIEVNQSVNQGSVIEAQCIAVRDMN